MVAWVMNKDGAIFATLSAMIAAIAGSLIGFTFGVAKAKIDAIEGKEIP